MEKTKKILEKMVLAPSGTDITKEAKLLGERITERERNLQEKFRERSKAGKILSDKKLSKMQEDVAEKWISNYKRKDKFSKDDLVFVPVFTLYGENCLAKNVVEEVMSCEKFDKEKDIIYHGRTYKYGDLGDNFVGLNDQIDLVTAIVSIGDKKKARKVMDSTNDLLVKIRYSLPDSQNSEIKEGHMKKMQEAIHLIQEKGIEILERNDYGLLSKLTINQFDKDDKLNSIIKELRESGFNVAYRSLSDIADGLSNMEKPMCLLPRGSILKIESTDQSKISDFSVLPYINVDTGKLLECDDYLYRENQSQEILTWLNAELSLGNNDLVSGILENLCTKDCHAYANPKTVGDAIGYLRIWKYLEKKDNPIIIEKSKSMLEECLIPEWGLYKSFRIFEREPPEMNKLKAYDQLNIALLNLYDSDQDKARQILTTTKNAGLYKAGNFIDRDCCGMEEIYEHTNALGMIVLEGLKNPDSLKEVSFNL